MNDFAQERIDETVDELQEERAAVAEAGPGLNVNWAFALPSSPAGQTLGSDLR